MSGDYPAWDNEPDKVEFEYEGYKCIVYRHPEAKHLCGYVSVPENHLFFKHDYSDFLYKRKVENNNPKAVKFDKDIAEQICDLDCHGGVTFTGYLTEFPDDWLIGFDAAHAWDVSPPMTLPSGLVVGGYEKPWVDGRCAYRTIEYMSNECKSMVHQLKRYERKT